jgi:superoxide reductase
MDRRNLLQLALAGAATTLIAPRAAQAAGAPSMAGGVYYTKEAPGRWGAKVAGHMPIVEVVRDAAGVTLNVATSHEMKGYEHYIVKHVVLDADFKFVAEKMFDPNTDKAALSSFKLGNYKGTVNVLSMCNKHDLWLATATV